MMNESATSDTRRTRRVTFAAAAMLTVALSVFGGLFYLQRQAASGQHRRTQAEIDAMHQPSEKQLDERLAKANWLREKLQPWALQHKDLFKAMLNAKADDKQIRKKVWNAIPPNPLPLGIKFEDLGTLESASAGVAWFSWNPIRRSVPADKAKREQQERKEEIEAKVRQKQFTELRDVKISGATLYGSTLCLWASGRVTKLVRVPNPDAGPGEPSVPTV